MIESSGGGQGVPAPPPRTGLLLLLGLLVAVLAAASLFVGRGAQGTLWDLPALYRENPALAELITWQIRLPRTLLALLTGFSLGVCGAALQGLLRNPLAEPGLLGASSGAALGAVTVFYSGLAGVAALALPAGGLLGAALFLGLLYLLSGRSAGVLTLILAGVALNALAAALTSLVLNFAPSPYAALEILFWMLGSLADRTLAQVGLALPWIVLGTGLILSAARGLDALALGEDTAASLGYSAARTQLAVAAGTAAAVGASVAVTGVVGFVGLVVPHLVRPVVGWQPSRVLLPSGLAGAALLTLSDLLIRMMPPGPELKLGVVTALIGAPFFLYLVIRHRWAGL